MVDTILKVTDLHAGYGSAEVLHGLNFRALQERSLPILRPTDDDRRSGAPGDGFLWRA